MPDKSIIWLGNSRRDLRAFTALAQKPMQTVGPAVREIRTHIAGAHRVF